MPVPKVEVQGCVRSHAVLLERTAGLTDEQAGRPSLLPEWTVGHVLTHIARNADSVTRRLEGAARGEVVEAYPGGFEGRAADIEAGAGRPAAELLEDVRESCGRMERAALSMPEEAWEFATVDPTGREWPASLLPYARWIEVETHHVDLDLGYGPATWPTELVAQWLPRELERLSNRADPNALLAWVVRRGPAPELPAW
ncbi:MAG TPA: maleylpyruvate isomerase N-terminal domain-containing protein [Acidimicrobiales bacterium]|nr:maleylpyruvate isomerase N-terminal domain-containing protein [Acidimicrobiales bacterium]